FVAMTLAAESRTTGAEAARTFRGPVLIDGGLPLPLDEPSSGHPVDDLNDEDLDTDDLIAAVLGPAAERLSMSFSTVRSEEHTSELQSRFDLVCRLLLEKKKIKKDIKKIL